VDNGKELGKPDELKVPCSDVKSPTQAKKKKKFKNLNYQIKIDL